MARRNPIRPTTDIRPDGGETNHTSSPNPEDRQNGSDFAGRGLIVEAQVDERLVGL
jgi:hypothetical protein